MRKSNLILASYILRVETAFTQNSLSTITRKKDIFHNGVIKTNIVLFVKVAKSFQTNVIQKKSKKKLYTDHAIINLPNLSISD